MKKEKIVVFTEKDFQALAIICDKMNELKAKKKNLYAIGQVYSFMFDNMNDKMKEKNKKALEKYSY